MNYTLKSEKSIENLVEQLKEVLPRYSFGLLHLHDIKNNLNNKGIDFETQCVILDVCNPKIAVDFLNVDLNLSCAMPCKITLHRASDITTIALNPLSKIVELLNPKAVNIAKNAEDTLKEIINHIK